MRWLHEKTAKFICHHDEQADARMVTVFCTPVKMKTTSADIFSVVDNFQQKVSLSWEDYQLCTEDASIMEIGIHDVFMT